MQSSGSSIAASSLWHHKKSSPLPSMGEEPLPQAQSTDEHDEDYCHSQSQGGRWKDYREFKFGSCVCGDGKTSVLLCDLDPQASLSKLPGVDTQTPGLSLYDALLQTQPEITAQELIRPTSMPGVSIIPATDQLANLETQLVSRLNRERTLRRVLRPLAEPFSFVLVDCPPALNLLTMNALTAADEVLIPVTSEFLALQALQDFLRSEEHTSEL